MDEEINYLDLLILKKIDAHSTVEKFGTQINTSFFEAANLLGTMKIKGVVDIQTSIGGQSPLAITGYGRDVLFEADKKYAEPLDSLDHAILQTLASGVRDLGALGGAISIRPKDLAFHLYKLKTGDYIDQEVRSSKVIFSLTEKGFNLVGTVRAITQQQPMPMQAPGGAAGAKPLASQASMASQTAQTASGQHLASDEEINDILNFGGFSAKKGELGKRAAGGQAAPAQTGAMPADAQKQFGQRKPQLDRGAMLLSKMEYYLKEYIIYGVLLLILIAALIGAAGYIVLTKAKLW